MPRGNRHRGARHGRKRHIYRIGDAPLQVRYPPVWEIHTHGAEFKAVDHVNPMLAAVARNIPDHITLKHDIISKYIDLYQGALLIVKVQAPASHRGDIHRRHLHAVNRGVIRGPHSGQHP